MVIMKGTSRTKEQIEHNRARISSLMLSGHGIPEIREIVEQETGLSLSHSQIGRDMAEIRKNWLATQEINYPAFMMQELDRIDVLERELWRQFRASAHPKVRKTIESYVKDTELSSDDISEEDAEKLASKITSMTESTGLDSKWMTLIIKTQQERRKLLGLYAPEHKVVQQEIRVKAYTVVSPGDWDEPLEGEYETIR